MSVPGADLQGWRWLRGRAGRLEYALWITIILTWGYLFALADDPAPLQVLSWAFWLQLVRRLHDLGRGGWWTVGFLVAETAIALGASAPTSPAWLGWLPGLFVLATLIALGALPGRRGENRFGAPPRRHRAAAARS